MVPGNHEDGVHRLPPQGQEVAGDLGGQGQAEIDVAVFHQGHHGRLGAVQQDQVHVGELLPIDLEELGQQVVQGGKGRRQAQAPLVLALDFVQLLFEGLKSGQAAPGQNPGAFPRPG